MSLLRGRLDILRPFVAPAHCVLECGKTILVFRAVYGDRLIIGCRHDETARIRHVKKPVLIVGAELDMCEFVSRSAEDPVHAGERAVAIHKRPVLDRRRSAIEPVRREDVCSLCHRRYKQKRHCKEKNIYACSHFDLLAGSAGPTL